MAHMIPIFGYAAPAQISKEQNIISYINSQITGTVCKENGYSRIQCSTARIYWGLD